MEDRIKMESEKLKTKTQNLPQGWRKVKLGEIEFKPISFFVKETIVGDWGKTRPDTEFNCEVYVIRGTDFAALKSRNFSGLPIRYIKKSSLVKRQLKTGDILIEISGGSQGQPVGRPFLITEDIIKKANKPLVHSNFCRCLKIKDEFDSRYVYYQLLRIYNSPEIYNYQTQSTGISNFHFFDFINYKEIPIFTPSKQKRIAEILSAFDDKIELNNKIIKTLEEMASEIFKEWFIKFNFPVELVNSEKLIVNSYKKIGYKEAGGKMVDSELGKIPEGWEMEKLPEVFDFLEGPGIRNWQYTSKGCRFINIRLIKNNDIDIKSANFISEKEAYEKYKHFLLQEGDMVVSTSGTLGRTAIVRKEHLPLMLNTSVIRFRPKDGKSYGFMYQFLKSDYFQNKLLSMASGSAQPNFGPIHLKQIELFVPEEKILENFNRLVNPIYEIIVKKLSENYSLSALRDLLLPKLMSGEIKVNSE